MVQPTMGCQQRLHGEPTHYLHLAGTEQGSQQRAWTEIAKSWEPCSHHLDKRRSEGAAKQIKTPAGLDEAQAEIKIARRNINDLRYADDTTLMVESEEGLKSLLMNVTEESESIGLKLNIQK